MFRIRRHYEASRERNAFPSMLYEEFLNVFTPLEAFTPQPCTEALNGYWVSRWNRLTNTPINIRQRCLGVDERRGLRLTTNVLVANDYGKERCAKDVDLYSWNRKICSASYNRGKDMFGEEINDHRPNVTDTRYAIIIESTIITLCYTFPKLILRKHLFTI